MKGANCPWVEIGPSGKNDNSPRIGFSMVRMVNCDGQISRIPRVGNLKFRGVLDPTQ